MLRLIINEWTNRLKRLLRTGQPVFPIRVRRMLKTGEMSIEGEAAHTNELLEEAGRLLDAASSHEILGEVIFLGADGAYYTISTEALITRVTPAYAKEAIGDEDDAIKIGATA